MTDLTLKHIWQTPGYRELTLDLIDDRTRKEFSVRIRPADLQHLINACADATRQIGTEPPIDWDRHPTQVYWPDVRPWRVGPRVATAGGR